MADESAQRTLGGLSSISAIAKLSSNPHTEVHRLARHLVIILWTKASSEPLAGCVINVARR